MCGRSVWRQQESKQLLNWASTLAHLPITDIAQCQNGALFCILTAIACSPNDVKLEQVNFKARTEVECKGNFIILQKLARSAKIVGLSSNATLENWMRIIYSKRDAQHYLGLLYQTLQRVRPDYPGMIEPEATAPPPPCFHNFPDMKPDTGSKAVLPKNRLFAPSDFGYKMPSGSLELELRQQDSSSSQEPDSIPSSVFGFLRYPQEDALGQQARESELYRRDWRGKPALEKTSSSSSLSCLEGFMFPEEDHDLRELVQQSMDTREDLDDSEIYLRPMDEVDAMETCSTSSEASSCTEIKGFLDSEKSSELDSYAAQPGHILNMMKDLDLILQALDST